ncbi:MAG: protein translocase subunit SecD [Planctomycetota bacterium]
MTSKWREPLWRWPLGVVLLLVAGAAIPLAFCWLLSLIGISDAFGFRVLSMVATAVALWPLWTAIALMATAGWLGSYLSRRWRMPDYSSKISVVSFCLLTGLVVTTLGWPPRLGVDLSGGVILVYELQDAPITDEPKDEDAAAVQDEKAQEGEGGQAPSGAEGDSDDEDEQEPEVQAESWSGVTEKLIEAIINRINPGGQKEITVRPYGERQIEVIIPREAEEDEVNRAEVERVKKKISSAGTLEFRILANNRDHGKTPKEQAYKDLIEKAKQSPGDTLYQLDSPGKPIRDEKGNQIVLAWWVPVQKGEEDEFTEGPGGHGEICTRTRIRNEYEYVEVLVVKDNYDVTGDYLRDATTSIDRNARPNVLFTFNTRGGWKFGGLTGDNPPDEGQDFSRRLGIILDGYLQSAPGIKAVIFQSGEITGDFTQTEVRDLVDILNAGKLPARLSEDPISEMYIGPTLGADTILRGQIAIGVSMGLVLLFMLFYYRFAGVIACMALLTNLLMILAIMISVRAALTLPGLAGLVLTVGMAVDANVLIFERIREELNRQATLRMAIRNGFDRAKTAILDANITTLITAVVLYWIGTDQIKGFAVTLFLGVLLSMFTAIYCSRVVFDVAEKQKWITKLSMLRILGRTSINFLRGRRVAAAVSIVVIVVGLGGVYMRGAGLLDIDFTGGVSVETVFKETKVEGGGDVNVGYVRKQLSEKLDDLAVSDVRTLQQDLTVRRFVINTSGVMEDEFQRQVEQSIVNTFGADDVSVQSTAPIPDGEGVSVTVAFNSDRQVGPVGDKLRREAGLQNVEVDGAGRQFTVSTTGLSQIAQVKAVLQDAFGEKLERYSMTVKGLDEPADDEALTGEASGPGETVPPTGGDSEAQSRADLPAPSLVASSDPSAVLLAQAEGPEIGAAPGDKPPKAPPAKVTPPKPAAEAPPKPAPAGEAAPAKTDAPSGGSETPAAGTRHELQFAYAIDYETLDNIFRDEIRKREDDLPTESARKIRLSTDAGFGAVSPDTVSKKWFVELPMTDDQSADLLDAIKGQFEQEPVFPSSNTIGGKVASGTRVDAMAALLFSLVGIVGYIWIRFQRVMFGLAAVVALVHDVLVTLGVIALTAYVAQLPFAGLLGIDEFKIGLSVLAAFLTIIGYSLNDTIVVFDRIREVRGKAPRLTGEMINTSINQTLSRTLLTSMTTLMVVAILYGGGGQGIHVFAFALVIGVVVGTYSSIFVASPVLYWLAQTSEAKQQRRPSPRGT